MDSFYSAASGLTYSPVVNSAFSYSNADYMRYGGTSFGGALLVAKQALAANQGTRFIHVEQGGWDLHQNIYDKLANPKGNLYVLASIIDNAAASADQRFESRGDVGFDHDRDGGRVRANSRCVKSSRRPRPLAAGSSRCSPAPGSKAEKPSGPPLPTVDPYRSIRAGRKGRDIKPEDIEATIYSAMGIDWDVCELQRSIPPRIRVRSSVAPTASTFRSTSCGTESIKPLRAVALYLDR